MTFCGVASNFAGVPLALAFIFTIGFQGLVTKFLLDLGFVLYPRDGSGSFDIYSKLGLEIVYLYFQFPLMVLIMAPAIDGLRREWREASENLGATSGQYWRHVALPILMPTILGTVILLFGNAFGAQATAYQLTGGLIPLPTLLIGSQISGDVFHNTGLGYAMAMGMVVIMAHRDRRCTAGSSGPPSGGSGHDRGPQHSGRAHPARWRRSRRARTLGQRAASGPIHLGPAGLVVRLPARRDVLPAAAARHACCSRSGCSRSGRPTRTCWCTIRGSSRA